MRYFSWEHSHTFATDNSDQAVAVQDEGAITVKEEHRTAGIGERKKFGRRKIFFFFHFLWKIDVIDLLGVYEMLDPEKTSLKVYTCLYIPLML